MKKTLILCAVFALALGVTAGVTACDSADAAAKKTSADGKCCPDAAAKAAYDKTYEDSGCSKTAQAAANDAMASAAYKNTYADSGCAKSATKAAYAAVQESTGCSKSATAAATHAAKQAAYDSTYAAKNCAKSATKAADEAASMAAAVVAENTEAPASDESAS